MPHKAHCTMVSILSDGVVGPLCLSRLMILANSQIADTSSMNFSMGRLYPKITRQLL